MWPPPILALGREKKVFATSCGMLKTRVTTSCTTCVRRAARSRQKRAAGGPGTRCEIACSGTDIRAGRAGSRTEQCCRGRVPASRTTGRTDELLESRMHGKASAWPRRGEAFHRRRRDLPQGSATSPPRFPTPTVPPAPVLSPHAPRLPLPGPTHPARPPCPQRRSATSGAHGAAAPRQTAPPDEPCSRPRPTGEQHRVVNSS